MLAIKDQEIAELKAALQKTDKKPKAKTSDVEEVDTETKDKAMEEVQELGKIRRKIDEQKPLTMVQYDNLVKYTDADTATINPRGDNLVQRRSKVMASFKKISEQLMPGEVFDEDEEDTFNKALVAIKSLVKEKKKEKV